jgi:hypothetical protein
MSDDGPGTPGYPAPDEAAALRAENEALRRRNEQLETHAVPPSGRRRAQGVLRGIAVVVLLVLGGVFATASVPAIWGRNLVLNTDRYVETLKPLASDPGIQSAVVKAVDEQFATHIDVRGLVTQALPGKAGTVLAGPLQNAATSLVNTVATRFVQSNAFVQIWVGINRAAHSALVDILTGKHAAHTEALEVRNGILILNLAPVIEKVKAQLVDAGLGVAGNVPAVGTTIKIAQVKGLTEAQSLVSLLNKVANWLPLLSLLCFAGAILAARRRRRAIVICALVEACAMVVLAIGVLIGRRIYLGELPLNYLTANDASRIFDTLVRFLREGLRIIFVLALLVCAIVWLTGSSRQARGLRRGVAGGARGLTSRWEGGRFATAMAANHGVVSTVIIALGALVLVLWTNPGILTVVVIALITAALVVLVYSLKPPMSRPV